MIMMRTFFAGLPEELVESARLDGATEFVIFFRIVLPLSKAVIATMVLFYAVGQWNSFMSPLLYLDDINRMPMQLIIRRIVIGSEALSGGSSVSGTEEANYATNVKYAAMFITILPILALYPFLQKYFVKGVMVGSLKG
jgi:putative aldouronate transport system permease protein